MKSCCCFSLRIGTILIGFLFTAISLVFVFFLSSSIRKTYRDDLPLLYSGLAGFSLLLLASVILIVGAFKKSRQLLLPWIVIFCLGLAAYVGSRLYYVKGSYSGQGPGELWFLLLLLVIVGINIYFLKVVIDYFKELKENRPEEGNGCKDDSGAENSLALNPTPSAV